MMIIITSSFMTISRNKLTVVLSTLSLAVFLHIIVTIIGNQLVLKFTFIAAILTIWGITCFKINFFKCIFTVLFCLVYYVLGDMTFILIFTELVGINVSVFLNDIFNYLSFSILVKITELLGILAICVWLRRRFGTEYVGTGGWMRTLVYPTASMVVSIYMIKIVLDAPETNREVFVCMVIVLFTDLASIFLANYLERQRTAVQNAAILRSSIKSELESVHAWQEAYSQQRKMTHEYSNQLVVIKGMIAQKEDSQEILDYINQIQSEPNSAKRFINTHRPVANVLINQKIAAARSKSIAFHVNLDDLSGIKLPDDALVVILANAIDNAIEAADKVEEATKRSIWLKIKLIDETTYISIKNYTRDTVHIKNNRVVTTKEDSIKHGYGLQNIAAIVSQYGGFYSLSYDEESKQFSLSIQL